MTPEEFQKGVVEPALKSRDILLQTIALVREQRDNDLRHIVESYSGFDPHVMERRMRWTAEAWARTMEPLLRELAYCEMRIPPRLVLGSDGIMRRVDPEYPGC